jgi:sulfoxide reductase catalytic subunit YedY
MNQDIRGSDITPEPDYINRRSFMRAGIIAGTMAATAGIYRALNPVRRRPEPVQPQLANLIPTSQAASSQPASITKAYRVDEPLTSLDDITHYNNFYEFSTDKEGVAPASVGFVARPWTIEVTGLCAKPKTFDLDELLAISPPEERIYRMRCVEAWSMVIPWAGFSLSKLLDKVEPQSSAKYVAFTTLMDPKRFPNQRSRVLDWPYVEGLRIDEAMHPLTLLASGLYGKALPPQDGAPLRLVVPWKYGFKGIKSIVKIELTARQPRTTWSDAGPSEYGFYANVNPEVDHPRWSQATERRIGGGRIPTLPFNGYGEQVASMYAGMDLQKNY